MITFNQERKFGVEFEVVNKNSTSKFDVKQALSEASILYNESGYCHNTNGLNTTIWFIKQDSSIIGDFGGFEIVSPVLKGYDGLLQVEKVCDILQRFCSVNKTTGFHVHHEATNLKDSAFRNLFNLYKSNISIINLLVSKSRRNNYYCQLPTNDHLFGKKSVKSIKKILINNDRYRAINFQSYAVRGTIEFRQHQGTVESKKAISWIIFTQAMIETANSKTSIANEKVQHMITLNNLFKTLGWIPEYVDQQILSARSYLTIRYKNFKKELEHENQMA